MILFYVPVYKCLQQLWDTSIKMVAQSKNGHIMGVKRNNQRCIDIAVVSSVREVARVARTAELSLPNIGLSLGEFLTELVSIAVESVMEKTGEMYQW